MCFCPLTSVFLSTVSLTNVFLSTDQCVSVHCIPDGCVSDQCIADWCVIAISCGQFISIRRPAGRYTSRCLHMFIFALLTPSTCSLHTPGAAPFSTVYILISLHRASLCWTLLSADVRLGLFMHSLWACPPLTLIGQFVVSSP